ncbi:MAG: hypothetical protein ABI333_10925 [bacterium]
MNEQRKSARSFSPWWLFGVVVPAVGILGVGQAASAQTKCGERSVLKLKRLNRDALDELDRWALAPARSKLDDAKLIAKARQCLQSPELAITYVLLGVVELRARKPAKMKAAWTAAFRIDRTVQLPKRVLSPKVLRLFRRVRATVKLKPPPRTGPRDGPRGGPRDGPPTDQPRGRPVAKEPKNPEHKAPKQWKQGQRLYLTVRIPDSFKAGHVRIFYRLRGASSYQQASFVKGGADRWSWSWNIAGIHLYTSEFRYFIVIYTAKWRPLVASGNALKPHIVQLNR